MTRHRLAAIRMPSNPGGTELPRMCTAPCTASPLRVAQIEPSECAYRAGSVTMRSQGPRRDMGARFCRSRVVRNAPSWTWRMPVAGRPVSPGVSLSAPSQSSFASVFELSNSREIVGVILVPSGPTRGPNWSHRAHPQARWLGDRAAPSASGGCVGRGGRRGGRMPGGVRRCRRQAHCGPCRGRARAVLPGAPPAVGPGSADHDRRRLDHRR